MKDVTVPPDPDGSDNKVPGVRELQSGSDVRFRIEVDPGDRPDDEVQAVREHDEWARPEAVPGVVVHAVRGGGPQAGRPQPDPERCQPSGHAELLAAEDVAIKIGEN